MGLPNIKIKVYSGHPLTWRYLTQPLVLNQFHSRLRFCTESTKKKEDAVFQNIQRNSSTFLYSDMWTKTTINKCHQDMYGIKIRGTFCRSCL